MKSDIEQKDETGVTTKKWLALAMNASWAQSVTWLVLRSGGGCGANMVSIVLLL